MTPPPPPVNAPAMEVHTLSKKSSDFEITL